MFTRSDDELTGADSRHIIASFSQPIYDCPANMRTARWLMLPVLCIASVLATSKAQDVNRLLQPQNSQFKAPDAGNLIPAGTNADEAQRRKAVIASMQVVMGPMPTDERRVDLDVQIQKETSVGTYTRRLITYQSEPGSRTPAYLCIPNRILEEKGRAAAVLCLHPTDNTVGHKVVVGLGGRPGRQYAAELAERGYVTLSPAYPHLANYWPNLGKLGYVSGTMKAIWDNSRGLDLLESLSFVDTSNGIAAIGHSLGGHNAIYTAVMDERISVVASSCGFDSYRHYKNGDESLWYFGKGWCQIRYMPRMSNYRGRLETIPFDFPDLLTALAPRPLFVNAPLHDTNFRWQSVDACATAAEATYRRLGAEGKITLKHPDCEHNFPKDMRHAAYLVIDSVLRPTAHSKKSSSLSQ